MPVDKDKAALAEAAQWFARLGGETVDDAERQRWRAWLAAAPEHAQAWARVEAIGRPFAQLRASTPLNCSRRALLEVRGESRRQAMRALGLGGLVFGGFALLGGALPRSARWQLMAAVAADWQTALGETGQRELDDGSRLSLNTATRVRIDFSEAWRRIVLYEGEILLESGVDREHAPRPLVVDTVHGRVEAIGTRFAVCNRGEQTRVDVFAGAVRLTPVDGSAPLTLAAGASGQLAARSATPLGPAAAAREGWAQGLLIADNVTLAEFLVELGRYTPVRLEAAAPVGALRLVGVYRIDEPRRDLPYILAALESSLPVRVETAGRNHLRLIAR